MVSMLPMFCRLMFGCDVHMEIWVCATLSVCVCVYVCEDRRMLPACFLTASQCSMTWVMDECVELYPHLYQGQKNKQKKQPAFIWDWGFVCLCQWQRHRQREKPEERHQSRANKSLCLIFFFSVVFGCVFIFSAPCNHNILLALDSG